MFFGRALFDIQKLWFASLGFICFCMISSAVYIYNDYKDVEKDRNHPVKKNRPLASGRISFIKAFGIMIGCILITAMLSMYLKNTASVLCLILYLSLNIAYSMGLKNKPIIDVVILASGFVIRIFYGGLITGIEISQWLYLVVITGSLYMGLGKRRNELKRQTETREVLKYYNISFLEKNMYVCVALANVFYALWTLETANSYLIWTVPIVIVILMRYSLIAEGDSDGDPVEVIMKDKILIALILGYMVYVGWMLYLD